MLSSVDKCNQTCFRSYVSYLCIMCVYECVSDHIYIYISYSSVYVCVCVGVAT